MTLRAKRLIARPESGMAVESFAGLLSDLAHAVPTLEGSAKHFCVGWDVEVPDRRLRVVLFLRIEVCHFIALEEPLPCMPVWMVVVVLPYPRRQKPRYENVAIIGLSTDESPYYVAGPNGCHCVAVLI
jgi:hypothetical protein